MRILPTLMLAGALFMPLANLATAQTPPPSITVTGEGVVETVPDMATIMLGVTTQGDTAAEAMAANNAAVTAVMERLTAAGIEARDMQTSNLSLGPDYSKYDSSAGGTPAAYVASNLLNVRVRAIDQLGAILDAAITDGANTLNGISFGLIEPRPALDEARRKAVEDARARATLLAEAAGLTLGPILSISEGGGMGNPIPMFRQEASDSAVPVAGGEIGVTASVTVVFGVAE